MRPAGEIRQALLGAAHALATPDLAPTQRELAEHAGVSYGAARSTIRNMVQAGVLKVVRPRRVAYRNRPVAEYAPAPDTVVDATNVPFDLRRVWFAPAVAGAESAAFL